MDNLTTSLKKTSLQHKLIIWFLLLTLVPLITISTLSYLQNRDNLVTLVTNKLSLSAQETKRFIDNWVNFRMMDITYQAKNISTVKSLNKLTKSYQASQQPLKEFIKSKQWLNSIKATRTDLFNMQDNYDYIHDIYLIDNSANILFNLSQESDLGTNLQTGKYKHTNFANMVLTSLKTNRTLWSKMERYTPSNNLISAFISSPLTNELGDLVGVLAIEVKLDSIYALMKTKVDNKNSLSHFIIDEHGVLLTPINNNWPQVLNKNITHPAYHKWQQQKSNVNTNKVLKYKNLHGEQVIGIFQNISIANIDCILVTQIALNEVLADTNGLAIMIFWLVVISAILITIVSIFLSKSITKPLIKLANTSLRVASGELELPVKQQSNDEIGQLTAAFNYMVEKRNKHQNELEESNKLVQQNANKLSLVINNTGVGFWDWEISTGTVECNPRWYEITGYSIEMLAPFTVEKFGSLLHPEDAPTVFTLLEQHLANETIKYDVEFRIKHHQGHWLWLHDSGKVVTYNKQGKPSRVIGTIADISERKRQTLLEAYNHLATQTKLAISKMLNQALPLQEKLNLALDECFKMKSLHLLDKGGVFLMNKEKSTLNLYSVYG